MEEGCFPLETNDISAFLGFATNDLGQSAEGCAIGPTEHVGTSHINGLIRCDANATRRTVDRTPGVISSKCFQVGLKGIHIDFVPSPELASPLHFNEGAARLVSLPWTLVAVASAERGLASSAWSVRSLFGGPALANCQDGLNRLLTHDSGIGSCGLVVLCAFQFLRIIRNQPCGVHDSTAPIGNKMPIIPRWLECGACNDFFCRTQSI